MKTVKLNNGIEVVAKEDGSALVFVNAKQVNRVVDALTAEGHNVRAYQPRLGPAFFVAVGSIVYEIKLADGRWIKVAEFIFRSWTGERRKDGVAFAGPVFVLGKEAVYRA